MSLGVFVGNNLDTDTDVNLKLSTDYSSNKQYKWVDAQFTTNGSGVGSVTVSHGLDFEPMMEVWGKHTAQFTFLSTTSYSNAYSLIDSLNSYRPYGRGIIYFADDENVTIKTVAVGGIGGGASPNTTYHFRVLVWVDPVVSSVSDSGITPSDIVFKTSQSDVDVLTGDEHEMIYSSDYKAYEYYSNHKKASSLTLPEMFASAHDTFVQEATYVDFLHNLGYPPRHKFYSDMDTSDWYEMPYSEISQVGVTYDGLVEVSSWCDANRIRVLFHRESSHVAGDSQSYDETTINLKMKIYTEDLTG